MFLIKYILNEITLEVSFLSARLISFGQLMSGNEIHEPGHTVYYNSACVPS